MDVNGQDYVVAVNESSTAGMALYNKLSKDKSYDIPMKPFNSDRYVGMFDSGLPTGELKTDIANWPTGSVVLIGNLIYIFKNTVSNVGAEPSSILATIDTTTMDRDSIGGWLRTMFNGVEDVTVKLFKY